MSGMEQEVLRVPVLRDDIEVLPFDSSSVEKRFLLVRRDGRRWHVSAYLERILSAIDGRRNTDEVAAVVSASMGRRVQATDIERVLDGFLATNDIVEPRRTEWRGFQTVVTPVLPGRRSSMHLRLRLIWGRPLRLVTRLLTWLFRGPVAWPLLSLTVVFQVAWCATHIDTISTAMHSSWSADIVTLLGLVFVSLFLHEFGHASACRAFGAKEGEIGFAVYLVFPVFYCDVTDAWKLARRERAALDLAGLYLQSLFATAMLATFVASGKSLFLWTFLAISASYIPNLNPFLKMDGYWFLSDMLGVANLSQRVGELLRGDHSTMKSLSRTMATLTYLYLVASIGYMAGFFYWIGSYAFALVRGGYMESVRTVQYASFGDVSDMAPALLTIVSSTLVLVFLPFLGWRTLRGCLAWMRDIAGMRRNEEAA